MGFLLVADIVKMAQKQMSDAGIEDVRNDSEALYCYLKHVDRTRFFMQWSEPADDLTTENYFNLVARRCKHEPLQLITGEQEFMGIPFKVVPGVLIPRQDTEVVCMAAEILIKEHGYKTLLDLCCGSGALGIALAKRTGIKATCTDISKTSVDLTRENAEKNGVKVEALEGDLFAPVLKKKFDIIVSNPPYIRTGDLPKLMPEIRNFEPMAALNGGEDGLDFYRRIVSEAPAYLKQGGSLVFEIGQDQAYDVTKLLEDSPAFTEIHLMKDLAHLDRVVTAEFDEASAKEAARQAEREAREAAKQAKVDAKNAAKQAKIDAKNAAKQAKIDARESARQAKIDAKEAARKAKEEAKEARRNK